MPPSPLTVVDFNRARRVRDPRIPNAGRSRHPCPLRMPAAAEASFDPYATAPTDGMAPYVAFVSRVFRGSAVYTAKAFGAGRAPNGAATALGLSGPREMGAVACRIDGLLSM